MASKSEINGNLFLHETATPAGDVEIHPGGATVFLNVSQLGLLARACRRFEERNEAERNLADSLALAFRAMAVAATAQRHVHIETADNMLNELHEVLGDGIN